MENNDLKHQIIRAVKNFNSNMSGQVNVLPYIIVLICIIIIFVYLVKIEVSSNGANWQRNKCSPKYVFFSGYLNNEGDKNPLTKTINNFNQCVKRFL